MTTNLQFPSNLISSPPIIDITDDLPKNPVKDWDALNPPRQLEDLKRLVIHHSGTRKSIGADALRHAVNHINYRGNEKTGDGGFPYHGYVREGQGYQCNDLLTFLYGVTSNNEDTVHICVEGDYANYDTLTDPDRKALYGLILAFKAAMPNFEELVGHNEIKASQCPGIDMDGVRADIQTLENKMARSQTKQARLERAFAVTNQAQYMYSLIGKGDGNEAWALTWFDDFHAYLKSKDMV